MRHWHLAQSGRSIALSGIVGWVLPSVIDALLMQARVRHLTVADSSPGQSGDKKLYVGNPLAVCPLADSSTVISALTGRNVAAQPSFTPAEASPPLKLPTRLKPARLPAGWVFFFHPLHRKPAPVRYRTDNFTWRA
jgi:hypothetical protein